MHRWFAAGFMLALLLTACGSGGAVEQGSVSISNQEGYDGVIVVERIESPADGWIAIHVNEGGVPGQVLGFSQVKAGVSEAVEVVIDPGQATALLFAVLHEDSGIEGLYEGPDGDPPMVANGEPVSVPFGVDLTP